MVCPLQKSSKDVFHRIVYRKWSTHQPLYWPPPPKNPANDVLQMVVTNIFSDSLTSLIKMPPENKIEIHIYEIHYIEADTH